MVRVSNGRSVRQRSPGRLRPPQLPRGPVPAHPRIAEQAHQLITCPNFFYNDTRAHFCAKLAEAFRQGCVALGMKVFSQQPSDSVSAILLPEGVTDKQFRGYLEDLEKKLSVH